MHYLSLRLGFVFLMICWEISRYLQQQPIREEGNPRRPGDSVARFLKRSSEFPQADEFFASSLSILRKWLKNPQTVSEKSDAKAMPCHVVVGGGGPGGEPGAWSLEPGARSPLLVAPWSLTMAGPAAATERGLPAGQVQP